jgi:hypothetical protein
VRVFYAVKNCIYLREEYGSTGKGAMPTANQPINTALILQTPIRIALSAGPLAVQTRVSGIVYRTILGNYREHGEMKSFVKVGACVGLALLVAVLAVRADEGDGVFAPYLGAHRKGIAR